MGIENSRSRREFLKGAAALGAGAALGVDASQFLQNGEVQEKDTNVYSRGMKEAGLERTKKDSFETQFEKREMVETAGGIAEVVDIKPDHPEDDVPVLFAPAWACTLPVYKPALKTLTEQGRRTLSL